MYIYIGRYSVIKGLNKSVSERIIYQTTKSNVPYPNICVFSVLNKTLHLCTLNTHRE